MNYGFNTVINGLISAKVVTADINNGYTWGEALNVVFCGLAIVFLMLILLVIIIKAFGWIMDNFINKKSDSKPEPAKSAPQKTVAKQDIKTETADDDEIIAVISAAVDSMYAGSGKKAIIKSVKRSGEKRRSNWAQAGIFRNTRAF